MGDKITEEVSNDLVEMDVDGTPRKVYPEIAEFFAARKVAEVEWTRAIVAREKAISDAVHEKKLAAIDAGTYDEFDRYSTQSQVEREIQSMPQERSDKYSDFMEPGRLNSRHRRTHGNPSSWEILTASPHKEVKWIAENCIQDNPYEALKILKHLPSTMDELYRVAKDDYEMCGVFDQYFERAKAAGVLKDEDMPVSAREWMALSSFIRRTYGGGYIRDLNQRIRPIVKAEVEHALAKAKAEWQGLDEARAENIRRNRSEGAKKAAATRAANRAAGESLAEDLAVAEAQVKEILEQEIPQISTQSAMTGEIFRSDIKPIDASA